MSMASDTSPEAEEKVNDIVAVIRMMRYVHKFAQSLDPPAEETAEQMRSAIASLCDYTAKRMEIGGLSKYGEN